MFNKHDQFIMNFIILSQIHHRICTGEILRVKSMLNIT